MTDKHWTAIRLAIIGFCIGLNIILGAYFLSQAGRALPPWAAELLYKVGFVQSRRAADELIKPHKVEPDLSPTTVTTRLNEVRQEEGLPEFTEEPRLTAAAQVLLQTLAEHEYDQEAAPVTSTLEAELKQSSYNYEWVSQHTLIGPFYTAATVTAIMDSQEQSAAVLEPEFSEIGVATQIVDHPEFGKIGATVLLFAKPAPVRGLVQPQKISASSPQPVVFPVIEDSEVIEALNRYRASHKVHQLVEHQGLCRYAEKRVADQVAYGGIDHHEGFIKDLADPSNPPEALKDYPGINISENLAYQHCQNMQTRDSFIAQTAAALIEWCFDSSTKGHREAQLNPRYNNVCVRHGQGYYVVLFGE